MNIQLNHQNYHTLTNRYLTGSRITDFLKCKKFFKELHITGERQKNQDTAALIIGSAVDAWLTRGEDAFKREFVAVPRRNLKNPPTGYTEITNAQFDEIVEICQVVEIQPAFLELKSHIAQEIIKYEDDFGPHFCGLAFIPDWFQIVGDTCIITDLKTAQDATERKYFWHCLTYRYFEQMAVATLIFRRIHPEIKNFVYRHLVAQKDSNGVVVPFVYILDNDRVEVCANIIKNEVIPMIVSEREFKAKTVEWKNAQTIGSLDNEWDD